MIYFVATIKQCIQLKPIVRVSTNIKYFSFSAMIFTKRIRNKWKLIISTIIIFFNLLKK